MKIKNHQDLYAGLMFAFFGGITIYLAKSYQLGTASDMGPGYFPFYLGVLLAGLGAILIVKSVGKTADQAHKVSLKPLAVFAAIMLFAVLGVMAGLKPKSALATGIVAGCILSVFIGMRTMGLVLGSVALFGLLIKGLGIVLSIAMLIILSTLASHEAKIKETVAAIIFMSVLSVTVFIWGLNLQMPIWPVTEELAEMFQAVKK